VKKTVLMAPFICLVLPLSKSSHAQVIATEDAPRVITLEGADVYTARKVLRRFFSTERHPECYRVLFSTLEGHLTVEFVPKHPDIRIDGEPEDPNEKPCGKNVGYVLDRDGNILRRLYSR
jgi:hypothetical protein